jgi:tetratricopeptide (TPR) repeat protein
MEKSAEPQLYLDKIERLNAAHPDWPFALVRLGKAYLLLEDLHEALGQFEKALSLLPPLQDEKFARYVEGLRAYIAVTRSPFVISSLDTIILFR